MTSPPKTPNRTALALAAALATTSCAPPEAPKNNLYDILAKYEFTMQDGKPANINALRASQKNKFSTLTFNFNGCTEHCSLTNITLRKVAKDHNALTHVVVNVQPQLDGSNQKTRDAFMQTFRKVGMKSDVVILYPKNEEDAIKIQNDAALIVNQKVARQHSSQILLFRPDGSPVGKKDGLKTDNFGDWQAIMQQEKSR